jgi:hypothetical protein
MSRHGYDAICLEIGNQAFPTFHSLSKNSWTNYFVVTNYARHNFSIDKIYMFAIIHTEKGLSKGITTPRLPKLNLVL